MSAPESWPEFALRPDAATAVLVNRPLRPGTDIASMSVFGDDRWVLTPAVLHPHADAASLGFTAVHPAFRDVLKLLCWLMINHDGDAALVNTLRTRRPAIMTLTTGFRFLRAFTDWLAARGRTCFSEVTALDLDAYLADVKAIETTHSDREDLLAAVIKIWAYRGLLDQRDRLPAAQPWGGERVQHLLECRRGTESTIARIPPETMNALLAWSLRLVEDLATDITAALHECQRLQARTRTPATDRARYQRRPGEVVEDLRTVIRAHGRLGVALPGLRTPSGALVCNINYLARLLDTSPESLRRNACQDLLRNCGLTIREGSALLLAPTGLIDGRRWRELPIDEGEVRLLARCLVGACFVVIGYLSGMRPGEILSLERGCLERDRASGLLLVRGRQWKGVRDDQGVHVPEGRIRPDPWVVAEPVATAITVLENLHTERLLFPNRLGARPQKTNTGTSRFRDGKARTSSHINSDIAALIDWTDDYCRSEGRDDPIPPDSAHPEITARRFRRTLAWFIARAPRAGRRRYPVRPPQDPDDPRLRGNLCFRIPRRPRLRGMADPPGHPRRRPRALAVRRARERASSRPLPPAHRIRAALRRTCLAHNPGCPHAPGQPGSADFPRTGNDVCARSPPCRVPTGQRRHHNPGHPRSVGLPTELCQRRSHRPRYRRRASRRRPPTRARRRPARATGPCCSRTSRTQPAPAHHRRPRQPATGPPCLTATVNARRSALPWNGCSPALHTVPPVR